MPEYFPVSTTAASRESAAALLRSAVREHLAASGIPVIGVYETMPAPGYDYQSWMTAEVAALDRAVTAKVSTEHL